LTISSALPVPRDRYLVGLLAPRQSYVSPSRFDAATAADPSGATSEDHVASPPQLVPSALGLTFAVPADTGVLSVEAAWGHYVRETIMGKLNIRVTSRHLTSLGRIQSNAEARSGALRFARLGIAS